MTRVLAATDFGEAANRALAAAARIASAHDAELVVVHAERFDPPPYFTVDQIRKLEAERREAQAAIERYVRASAAVVTDYPVRPLIVDAPPVEAILRASAGADLIVVGTHGRHGPGRWWLGSVAERVVRAAGTPVLVVKSAGPGGRDVFDGLAVAGDPPAGAIDSIAGPLGAAAHAVTPGAVDGNPVTLFWRT